MTNVREVLMRAEPELRGLAFIAHLLESCTDAESHIQSQDHECVCWLVGELRELSERLIKICEDVYAATRAPANQI